VPVSAIQHRSSDLTTDEAARALGVSPGTIRRYIARGLIAAGHFGRDYVIQASALNNFQRLPMGRPAKGATTAPSITLRCMSCNRVLRKPGTRKQCWRCAPDSDKLTRAAESARERRAQRRAAGLCPECGRRPPEANTPWTCAECRRLRDQGRERRRGQEAA